MKIVKVVSIEGDSNSPIYTNSDVKGILCLLSKYKFRNNKNEEIISFLSKELKRIAEFNRSKDIEKYTKAINYYLLEDQDLHKDAMDLKIKYYSKGGKFPHLPMINLFSLSY